MIFLCFLRNAQGSEKMEKTPIIFQKKKIDFKK